MEGNRVYGVSVACEATIGEKDDDLTLGVVIIKSPSHTDLSELRNVITAQVDNLPIRFGFLTQKGWDIKRDQESNILLPSIATHGSTIRIVALYDKPRIGILQRNQHDFRGFPLGFIFISYSATLAELRSGIKNQLGNEIISSETKSYQFLDRNGWPINLEQEQAFKVVDLLRQRCILIQLEDSVNRAIDTVDSYPSIMPAAGTTSSNSLQSLSSNNLGPPVLSRQPTFIYEKNSPQLWPMKSDTDNTSMEPKQVLLSYVRNEASEHACHLKQELTKLGHSVFLDVDEIKSGLDWQDSLNFAVANCETFVPLVTPHYGETQWTNREVKMADVLGKFILPITFIDHWPPRVLAIQFATTQFLPWKPQKVQDKQSKDGELDIRTWEMIYIKGVAQQIAQRLQDNKNNLNDSTMLKKAQTLRSCPAQLPNGFEQLSQNREGRPLIVISVHPQQRNFVIDLKFLLESKGYEVWCTIEWDEDDSEGSDTQLFSQDSGRGGVIVCSQESQMSSSSDCETICKNLKFQEKADAAGVILVVLSKAFAMSKTCKQQVFYCEHRKKIIPIKFENFCMPSWISMLIGTGILEDVDVANYKDLLVERVEQFISFQTNEAIDRQLESQITAKARELREKMPEVVCTYISGGTQFYHQNSLEICKFIGKYLAEQEGIHLATGGFQGVGETVALSYKTAKAAQNKRETIWHILPERDPKERLKCRSQKEDGTFGDISYGTTLFSGNSVREREIIVSRVFDICILIEGGPGAAHEAEQFAWSDHVVIPIKHTGGAAGGKFNVPSRIFEVPYGVSKESWAKLQDPSSSPEEIGWTVGNIVSSIKRRLYENKTVNNVNKKPARPCQMTWKSSCSIGSNDSVNSLDETLTSAILRRNTHQENLNQGEMSIIQDDNKIQTVAAENLPSISSKCLMKPEKELQRNDTLLFTELKPKQASSALDESDIILGDTSDIFHPKGKGQHNVTWKNVESSTKSHTENHVRKHSHHNVTQKTHSNHDLNVTTSVDLQDRNDHHNTSHSKTKESDHKSSKHRTDYRKHRSSSSEGNVVHGSPRKKTRQTLLVQNGEGDVPKVQSGRQASKERESKSTKLSTPSGKMRMQVQL